MEKYTENEVKVFIKAACQMQQAADYQIAGNLLIVETSEIEEGASELLDALAKGNGLNLSIKDVKDFIAS